MPNIMSAEPATPESITDLVHQLDLTIVHVPTQGLVALGRKARRRHKSLVAKLVDGIAKFGFLVPIIIDESGKVLAGNGRVEAARLLGLATVPAVVVSHLSPAQKRIFVLADNRLAELADWDHETLALELDELRNLDIDFNIELTGFTDAQVDGLLASVDEDQGRGDQIPLAGPAPVSQPGDMWLLDQHRLICGDATDASVLAQLLRGEGVRTVFADPPYNLRISGEVIRSKGHGEFVMGSGEFNDTQFTDFLSGVWARVESALLPGGLAYVAMDWRHAQNILEAMDGKALDLLNLIVWHKSTFGMGGFYRSQHELIFLAKKRGGEHTNRIKFGQSGRNRSNVWVYPGVQGFGAAKARIRELHPTVKPMALVRDALLDSSDRGDVVLDPFSGSGTTLIAAEVSKRKGRAVELDPLYVDTGVVRWQDFTGKEAVLAATGETFAQVRARRAVASVQNCVEQGAPAAPTDTSSDEPCRAAKEAV